MATGKINIGPTLVVDNAIEDNISIDASGAANKTFSCAKTGYTAIGVVGFSVANASSSGSNASYAVVRGCFLASATTVTIYIRNDFNAAAKVKATVYVLYRKNS